MTLIEMLVAVSILAVMILMFSSILVQSQQYISFAQTSRRSHALAFSLARAMRRDIRRASQNGFLAITENSSGPLLMFTTAGTSQAICTDATGAGSLVCYGMVPNGAGGRGILWRPAYVLTAGQIDLPGQLPLDGETLNINPSQIERFPRLDLLKTGEIDSIAEIVSKMIAASNMVSLRMPPRKASEIDNLWQVLIMDASGLSITWTDGEPDGSKLRWFGIEPDEQIANSYSPLYREGRYLKCERAGLANIEATADMVPGAQYCALWTHENMKNWPKAIKIRFRLFDKIMPKEFRGSGGKPGLEYEVICNLGQ